MSSSSSRNGGGGAAGTGATGELSKGESNLGEGIESGERGEEKGESGPVGDGGHGGKAGVVLCREDDTAEEQAEEADGRRKQPGEIARLNSEPPPLLGSFAPWRGVSAPDTSTVPLTAGEARVSSRFKRNERRRA